MLDSDEDPVCARCGAIEGEVRLETCRLCFKVFCGDCAYKATWGRFCTQTCAQAFFFGDQSEESDVDDDG